MKSAHFKTTHAAFLITAILLCIGLIGVAYGLISLHHINDGASQTTSDQQLTCYWTLNETTTANVTWFKNGIANTTQTDIPCTANQVCSTNGNGNIPASFTTRNDVWICSVFYNNGSAIENHNVSVTIVDSPPTSPRIYWPNNTEIVNVTAVIAEDSVTTFTVNSTDADGDSITYLINDTTYCSINTTGALRCAPTAESHNGFRIIRVSADTQEATTHTFFMLNVTPVNDAPYFSPSLQNKTVTEGNALNYNIFGGDDELDTPYTFMIAGLNSLILNSTAGTTAKIMFNNSGLDKASFADRGNHTINVTIIDNGSPSKNSTVSFRLEIIPTNHVANMTIVVVNSTNLIQGGPLLVYINASDIDNDTITFFTNNSLLYNISYSATDHTNPSGVSSATALINVTNLTNDHVINREVSIIAFDSKENTSTRVFLNITNTNDFPIIYDNSFYAGNTLNNTNISALIAYTGVSLSYRVNASDVDSNTYEGDTITFSTNDSNFPINTSTGIIKYTPSASGNYSFLVTVTDSHNAKTNHTAMIEVLPNTNPSFTQNPIIIRCFEYDATNYPFSCYYNMSSNVTDLDSGDYVASFAANTTIFTIDPTSGIINFSANQSFIGNNSITLNITDSRGGTNSTTIYVIINNTNNAPQLGNPAIPSTRFVIGNTYNPIPITATDNDLLLTNSTENLTFALAATGPVPGIFSIAKTSSTQADLSFTATTTAHAGNYTINVTVNDTSNNVSKITFNIVIYNITAIPNITQITPFGSPYFNNSVNTSWRNASDFPKSTSITIAENSTYTFDETSFADNATYPNTLTYAWYIGGVLNATTSAINKNFGFFSAGAYNITFVATDDFNYSNSFTWLLTVNNVNRAPVLANPLVNLIVDGTTTYNNYMTYYNSQTRFIDYDDDPDGDNQVVGNASTLIFTATPCAFANFTFIQTDLKVKTIATGECYVNFTAIDAQNNSLAVTSNTVLINITSVSNETSETPITVTTTSSGGGSSTITIPIPLPVEVDRPKPLQIITPKLVTIYKNAIVKVPIVLNNTWNGTLEGITLGAKTNATNVTIYFDKAFFPRIYQGQSEEATLTIENYKSDGHYEIQIIGNVTNPEFHDVATIFVNSADAKSEGDSLETKISFAQDLLSSNPECQELTELLNQAKKELAVNNYKATGQIVDDVIDGCKYLVSNAKNTEEKPSKDFINRIQWNKKYGEYIIIGIFCALFIVAAAYIIRKDKSNDF
jgi:hypothetical protein